MSVDKTPLQRAIKEAIEKHPTLDDKEIAQIAFQSRYPEEKYEGTDPTKEYVARQRKRIAQAGEPPEFIIEVPEELEEPEPESEIEEPEAPEKPEIPFPDDFEPPELEDPDLEEPEIEFDPTEGFNLDDTEFLLCFTFDKFADWTGYEGWRFSTDTKGNLTDKNEIRFAGLTHRMMDKYMPDILDQYFLEFMFCYTGIMLIGSKAKGYRDYRKRKKPDPKNVESTVIEKPLEEEPTEETPAEEIPIEETPRELPLGARAHGEEDMMKRLRRQTP